MKKIVLGIGFLILSSLMWFCTPAADGIRPEKPVFYGGGSGAITGVVKDKETGDGLPGVNVILEGTSQGATTDTSGHYQFNNVPAGIYSISTSMIGYSRFTVTKVEIIPSKTISLDLELAAANVQGTEIVTKAKKPILQMDETLSAIGSAGSASKMAAGRGVMSVRGGAGQETERAFYDHNQPQIQDHNTEAYDRIYENEFVDPVAHPLSTFSIDVDAASYSNVRRFIMDGQLPPPDAVRTEEMVNYFMYDYAEPTDQHPFAIHTELATCPWNKNNKLLMIGLQGKRIPTADLPASNLVFLLDVSGSMDEPNKLPLVKSAFRMLVEQLRPIDRVAIVVYAGNAGLVLPSTPGDQKQRIMDALSALEAGGSTAGGQGIQLAYKVAMDNFLKEGNNRVILATDGDFNVGVSSDGELVRIIEEKRGHGIYLSVLGFGTGNYKDSKMEKLADKGNGNFAYIDNILEAKKVFVSQMAGTLFTIAKDVKLQLEFNPARVKSYRLIGYENRLLQAEDFNNDRKDAGEMGSGHTVTAFYEIVPADGAITLPAIDPLKYQRVTVNSGGGDELMTIKFRYKPPQDTTSLLLQKIVADRPVGIEKTSENFRFASSVAAFSGLLRNSQFKGETSYARILELARNAKGIDREGYRAEFIRLVESCQLMAEAH